MCTRRHHLHVGRRLRTAPSGRASAAAAASGGMLAFAGAAAGPSRRRPRRQQKAATNRRCRSRSRQRRRRERRQYRHSRSPATSRPSAAAHGIIAQSIAAAAAPAAMPTKASRNSPVCRSQACSSSPWIVTRKNPANNSRILVGAAAAAGCDSNSVTRDQQRAHLPWATGRTACSRRARRRGGEVAMASWG